MKFGDKLKQARLSCFFKDDHGVARQFTQTHLADILEINDSTVSLWEASERMPTILTLMKLCRALGVLPNDLIIGAEDDKGRVFTPERVEQDFKLFGYRPD
jgi:transcriptional regulator with XRE-family HTH domain